MTIDKRNVHIVLAHPEPASFSAALAASGAQALRAAGHSVTLSDLYAESFRADSGRDDFTTCADPNRFHYQTEQAHAASHGGFAEDIAREQARVSAADLLILHFPLWWGGPPAILKGWLDRVMAYGFAYVDGARFSNGLFSGRQASICVSTGGTQSRFSEEGVYGPIENILMPVSRLALEYMGYEVEPPFIAYAAPRVTSEERAAYLAAWAEQVANMAQRPIDRNMHDDARPMLTPSASITQSENSRLSLLQKRPQ